MRILYRPQSILIEVCGILWPVIPVTGFPPGSREAEVQWAQVCLSCTQPGVARSSQTWSWVGFINGLGWVGFSYPNLYVLL